MPNTHLPLALFLTTPNKENRGERARRVWGVEGEREGECCNIWVSSYNW